MSAVIVCPLSRLAATVENTGARHVVTLINAGTPVPLPASVERADHHYIAFNDILEPMDGMTCPADEHVGRFLDFFAGWNRLDPVIVHCFAGVSRSTAGAFTALCALRPDLPEDVIAARLRARSPQATPNARFVALADRALGRGGRMSRAIAGIGRGVDAFEGSVFSLPVDE